MATLEPNFRSARLDNAPLDYAPVNEKGVIFLFSHLAKKRYGLRIERVQAGFPDCLAFLGTQRVRIEFEYRSRNFVLHGHDPEGCDWIVCWIHDWPSVPERIRVVELRQEFGLGFNVWFQPVGGEYTSVLAKTKFSEQWSVPSRASDGDLILFYRTKPDHSVRDIFRLSGPVKYVTAGWKPGKDWMGPIRRVCTLSAPLHLSEMQGHRVIGSAGFIRGSMRGRYCASQYWPDLYTMILARNPAAKPSLLGFGPQRLA